MKHMKILVQELPKVRDTTGFEHRLYFCTVVKVVHGKLLARNLFRNVREELTVMRFSSKFADVRG